MAGNPKPLKPLAPGAYDTQGQAVQQANPPAPVDAPPSFGISGTTPNQFGLGTTGSVPATGGLTPELLKTYATTATGTAAAPTGVATGMPAGGTNSAPQGVSSGTVAQTGLRDSALSSQIQQDPYALTNPTGTTGLQNTMNATPQVAGGRINTAPTPTPGTGTPDSGAGAASITSFYDNLMKQQTNDWAQQQGLLKNQMGGFEREADSLNARMGGSIAGGYAGLAGAGLGKGMDAYNKASLAYNQLRQATGKDEFGALNDERQRQEEMTHEDKQRADDTEMRVMELAVNNDMPIDQAQKLFDSLNNSSNGQAQTPEDKAAALRKSAAQAFAAQRDAKVAALDKSIAELTDKISKTSPWLRYQLNVALQQLKAQRAQLAAG